MLTIALISPWATIRTAIIAGERCGLSTDTLLYFANPIPALLLRANSRVSHPSISVDPWS